MTYPAHWLRIGCCLDVWGLGLLKNYFYLPSDCQTDVAKKAENYQCIYYEKNWQRLPLDKEIN